MFSLSLLKLITVNFESKGWLMKELHNAMQNAVLVKCQLEIYLILRLAKFPDNSL